MKEEPAENLDFNCTCGHTEDEHGGNEALPGSSACNVDDCDCVCYERDGDDD